MAVWPQVHGESRQPGSQLCLPALPPAQPRVCLLGFRHTLRLSAACLLPALLLCGGEVGVLGPGSWVLAPQPPPPPQAARAFCTSGELAELCGRVGGMQGGLAVPGPSLAGPLAQRLVSRGRSHGEHGWQTCCSGDSWLCWGPCHPPGSWQESWVLCDGQTSWSRGRPGASWRERRKGCWC